jgi:opacity protein-like surface antigen
MVDWKALAAAVWVAGGIAQAAELPPVPALPPLSQTAEAFGGWYLRGDIGAGLAATPGLEIEPSPVAAGVSRGLLSSAAVQSFANTTLSATAVLDAGLGYAFNPWLRVDGTLEYRTGANLRSIYSISDPAAPAFGGPFHETDVVRAGLSSLVALANAYVDLGEYWGVTPFIGAGIGVADNALSSVSDQRFGSAPGLSAASLSNGEKASFAWALMAGLDYNLSANLKLELSYRYLNLGSVATGGSNCPAGASLTAAACFGGAASTIASRRSLASNDIRIGLIWLVGAAEPAPAPLTARY